MLALLVDESVRATRTRETAATALPAPERVVLTCGGTGGHVYPAIAIARALQARFPSVEVSFVGRPDSYESRLLEREGLAMDPVDVGRLAGQGALVKARTLAALPLAVLRAGRHLARRRPDVVIGTGGFVSGPVMLAAVARRLPTLVQEQNAVAGLTNRVLRALVDRVALAHEPEGGAGPRARVTGNPVRPEFFQVPGYRRPPGDLHVLVLGGSQGARSLNRAAAGAAALLSSEAVPVRLTIQCGPRWEDEMRAAVADTAGIVEVVPYVHDLPRRLADASLVVCRAGASTVAEICAAGRPAVLVPFPHAAGDHQTANARALAEAGAAELVPDAALTAEAFAGLVRRALVAPDALVSRARAARDLARPDAADAIVDLALEALARRRGGRP